MSSVKQSSKNIFILGITSDIGTAIAKSYINDGHKVFGTYRNKKAGVNLAKEIDATVYHCDISDSKSLERAIESYAVVNAPWDIFVSAVGTSEPLGNFFSCDFNSWEKSININCIGQLRALHILYPYRRVNCITHVVFFAGGGTNNPFPNFSAYCTSKIMLIKMCELLDDENKDLNVFIVGPGWVKTKIHNQVLDNPQGAGGSYQKVQDFLNNETQGTSNKSIYECINWCIDQGRDVVGGRNFSVVHDSWRDGGRDLVEQLYKNPDKFKLRRSGNDM